MVDKPQDKPPTSKLGRFARLAVLSTKGFPLAFEGAKRALGLDRDRSEADEKRAGERLAADSKKAAEAMLKTLGEMKGLPLKVGQMMSYIDGIAPPGYEEKFKATLKSLQDKAPPLSPEAAIQVITEELGAPPEQIFAEWEREPFAAASIGQVHRALTKGGDRVAVKVQYPGIDKAIKNDLKSIHLLGGMLGPHGHKTHVKDTIAELSEVFLSELDYAREAEMADVFRRMHQDDPQIVIPRVYQSLSTARVLTTELLGGIGYQERCDTGSEEERTAAGLAVWRFMFGSLLKHGYLYADPHPGNYRFLSDGRVGFLDFGCVKYISPELMHGVKRYMRAAMDENWEEFDRACVEVLDFKPNDPSWKVYRDYTLFLLDPIRMEEFRCSPERAREAVTHIAAGMKSLVLKEGETLPTIPHVPKMPREFVFMNRLQWGLASVLGGLGTRGRFRELTEPWIRGATLPVP